MLTGSDLNDCAKWLFYPENKVLFSFRWCEDMSIIRNVWRIQVLARTGGESIMQRIASLVVVLGALVNNGLGASCSATDGGCSGATRDDGGCGASCDAGCCESLANADCFGCGWRVHANSLVWTRDIQNSAELVQPRMAGEAFNLADAPVDRRFWVRLRVRDGSGHREIFFCKCGYPAEMAFTFRYIDSWESKFGGTFCRFR